MLVLFVLALVPVTIVAAADSSSRQAQGQPPQDPDRVPPVSMTVMERVSNVPNVAQAEPDAAPLDNKPGKAIEMQCGETWYGTINKAGDVDYYKFYAQRGETFMATAHGSEWGTGLDPTLTLYDSNGKTLLWYVDDYDALDPLLHFTFYEEGWFFLAVRGFADLSMGDYYLQLEKPLYVSTRSGGTVDWLDFSPGDVLQYNSCGDYWDMFLDADSLGFNGNLRGLALSNYRSAFVVFDKPQNFYGNPVTKHDIAECSLIDIGWDAWWDCYLMFDGEDVGLTQGAETINSIGLSWNGELLMSFDGPTTVPDIAGKVADDDILAFSPSQFGSDTSGYFYYWLDGSDVGLNKVQTEGIWANPYWNDIYQVFNKSVKVDDNLKLDKSDVGVCYSWGWLDDSYCGNWWELFDATDAGLNGNIQIDAIDLGGTAYFYNPYNPYPAPIQQTTAK